MDKFRKRLFEILEPPEQWDLASRVFDMALLLLISLNVLAIIIESMGGIPSGVLRLLRVFQVVSVGIFSIEYLLRLWTCTLSPKFARPISGRMRFVLSPMAIVDLLAILPFYLPMLIRADLRFLRAVRLLRLSRLVKMGRYSRSLRMIGRVLRDKKVDLLTTGFVGFILLIIASSAMYYAENDVQAEFSSIPAAMWWGVITLTTVGYGDVFPVTVMGKIIASSMAFLGIGMLALPTAILGSAFVEELRREKEGETICPHCGKNINDKEPVP
ncbi:ion transporter [Candidatus Hydrogenedentota bacterium]